MDDWLDQLRAEVEKQAANRIGTLESLFISGDFEVIKDWISVWEKEDQEPDSLRLQYEGAAILNRLDHLLYQRHLSYQRQCLEGPGADPQIEPINRK